MLRFLGWLWMLGGAACMLWGIAGAIGELRALYAEVLDDAMAERELAEEDRASKMLAHAIKGGIGVPMFVAGAVMLKTDSVKRKHRAKRS